MGAKQTLSGVKESVATKAISGWALGGRGLVSGILVLLTAFFYPEVTSVGLQIALITVGYALLVYLLKRHGYNGRLLGVLETGADLGVVTAWLWALRSPKEFFWLYYAPCGLTALQYGRRLAVAATVLSVGLYLGLAGYQDGRFAGFEQINWLHSLALLGIGLLLSVAPASSTSSTGTSPELLDQFAQTLEEVETSQRELRASYRELVSHYRRLQESFRSAQDALELFSLVRHMQDNTFCRRLLEYLTARFGASGAALWLTDETSSSLQVQVATGVLARFHRRLRANPTRAGRWLEEVKESLLHYLRTCSLPELAQLHQASEACLSIPLRSPEHYYGVLSLVTTRPGGFEIETEERLRALVSPLTAILGIQHQLNILQTRLRKLEALSEMDQLLFLPDPQQCLGDRILQAIQPPLKFEYATLYLADKGGQLQPAAVWNEGRDLLPALSFEAGKGLSGWIASHHRPLFIPDVASEPHPHELGEEFRGVHSYMAVCLSVGDQVYGALSVAHSTPNFFTEAEFEILQVIASHATLLLERANLLRQLETLAITDGLTNLYNYRYFQTRYQEEIKRAHRYGTPLALLLMDIDWFKNINDRYGHMQGDHILIQLAHLLSSTLRETELIARYGGDEFVVLLTATDLKGAYAAAERLREAVAEYPFQRIDSEQIIRLTVSIGVAAYPTSTQAPETLLELADSALDQAKRNGRNRTVAVE